MGRQLDLEKQGREGLFICKGDPMWRKCIYDGVRIGQQVIDRCVGLSFAIIEEENRDQEKQGLFNYSVSF